MNENTMNTAAALDGNPAPVPEPEKPAAAPTVEKVNISAAALKNAMFEAFHIIPYLDSHKKIHRIYRSQMITFIKNALILANKKFVELNIYDNEGVNIDGEKIERIIKEMAGEPTIVTKVPVTITAAETEGGAHV